MMEIIRFWENPAIVDAQLEALLSSRKQHSSADIARDVAEIIAQVRSRGDAAVLEYTTRFDHVDAPTISLTEAQWAAYEAECPAEVQRALSFAAGRVTAYHERQKPQGWEYLDAEGNRLGMRWSAVDAAGVYVPGGKASYPSSVLMNVIPARVAGVGRIAMTVPTPHGVMNPAIAVAARLAGVDEIYCIGGAHAIAALAYGTSTIAAVHMIAGPGNAYVAEAKRQVFGDVGIDMIAGPSEILVIADGTVPAAWVAADMLSQAEHDEMAQSLLVCLDADYGKAVITAMQHYLATLPREKIARAALRAYGAVMVARDREHACALANMIAGEHVELAVAEPEQWAEHIIHAGALFMGRYTPEAIGDYVAGPSHVLPTTRSAQFASGLSVYHFMKKTSLIDCTKAGFHAIKEAALILAECEGLEAHALSMRVRSEGDDI
ncbi:MAG: histidinol dehydrogenase [Alphaproteobacteria bacterium]|nr:MAG: histidinol dehydrogenase [Alphaproteobacteria bacterium]